MKDDTPVVLVFAGPNGSGKSTVTNGFEIVGEYINADEIKKLKRCSDLEAAQEATLLREKLVENEQSFTFETVLSSPRNIELLKMAKRCGYWIEVVFVLTHDVEINVNRVKNRVKNGGHDVPEDKIRSRYKKSLLNLSELLKFADVVNVVDNSSDKAELLISLKNKNIKIFESTRWTKEEIETLINPNIKQ